MNFRLVAAELAVPVLPAAVACGGSSPGAATTSRLVTFSRSGEIYVIEPDGAGSGD
jgi:hypothetical protein